MLPRRQRIAGAAERPGEIPLGTTLILLTLLFAAYQVMPLRAAAYLPLALFGICAATVLRALRLDRLSIWNPLLWFLIASAVYYGIGPLIFLSGDDVIISYIQSYNFVDDASFLRTNVLNVVSIIGICAVYGMCSLSKRFGGLPAERIRRVGPDQTGILLALMAGIGWGARLVVDILRATRGEDAVMFGILFNLAELSKVAVGIAVYRYATLRGRSIIPVVVIGCAELYFAIGTLMKQQVLEVLFLAFLGWFLANPTKRAVAITAASATLAYLLMVPLFSEARNETWSGSPYSVSAGVAGAGRALKDLTGILSDSPTQNWWWSRLSQVPAQTFAMEAHDAGQAGNTFAVALATPIPRVIWPDKPVVNYGAEFTTLVKGDASSGNSGPGFFAEAYWNLGWLGVLMMCTVTGATYAWFARRNVLALDESDLRWLPVAYLSLKMGYRPDDWFVATVIGPLPIMAAIWLLISQSMNVLARRPVAEVPHRAAADGRPSLSRV
jgi:hypothetical protein